ncbi:MAG: CBS domain-containing protein [Longimonas sp.]|uniref:CBS domain-containing protein n=1 Tax=Longimonas sp. TaxID=2039626 RepID=UPI00335F8F9D
MKYTQAKDIMTRTVHTVEADRSLQELSDFFIEYNVTGAPVVDEAGALIGVVSVTDLTQHLGGGGNGTSTHVHTAYHDELAADYAQEEVEALRITETTTATVRDVMTPEIYDVNPHTSIQQVADVMLRSSIRRLFVTRDGQVEGVITSTDMLKVIREL